MPLVSQVATVVTLHDATFFTDPGVHSPVKARFFRAWTQTSLRRADVCVVPSASTARELGRVAGAEVKNLHVAHHGVDADRFHPPSPEEIAAVRHRLRLGGSPYVAFLGALEPRKNVPALIRGFALASQVLVGRSDPPVLVLAGQPGWDSQVERELRAVPHRVRVIRAGYLPLAELSGFLGGAAVVAYCGIGAADIAAGLVELLDDPARRAELSAAAQRRAKDFSWAASAPLHREAYSRAAVVCRRSR